MKMFQNFIVDLQLISHIFWRYVLGTWKIFMWLVIFVMLVFILQWLFNIEQLWFILGESSISSIDKLIFLQEGFFNIFRLANDIVPVSIILIAFMQATAITLFWAMRSSRNKAIRSQVGPMSVGLVGAGCVACGGSILTPLLGAIASNFSFTLAERLSDIILIIAVVLSYRALSKISFVYANEVAKIT